MPENARHLLHKAVSKNHLKMPFCVIVIYIYMYYYLLRILTLIMSDFHNFCSFKYQPNIPMFLPGKKKLRGKNRGLKALGCFFPKKSTGETASNFPRSPAVLREALQIVDVTARWDSRHHFNRLIPGSARIFSGGGDARWLERRVGEDSSPLTVFLSSCVFLFPDPKIRRQQISIKDPLKRKNF